MKKDKPEVESFFDQCAKDYNYDDLPLLKIELEYCTNRSLVNFAGHLQMVGKKV